MYTGAYYIGFHFLQVTVHFDSYILSYSVLSSLDALITFDVCVDCRPTKYKQWSEQFPWLDKLPSGLYVCTICKGANKANTFARGTRIKVLRSIRLLKHEISKDHLAAKGDSLEGTITEYTNRDTKHAWVSCVQPSVRGKVAIQQS